MTRDIHRKAAIVTGAGSGICLAFARLLLSKGVNVLFADLSLRPEAQALVDAHSSTETRAIFQKTDVRDWVQLSSLFDTAIREFGGIDIVCPGAGIYEPDFSNFWIPPGSPGSQDPVDGGHYALIDINLTHPIRMTQLAISHFTGSSPSQGLKYVVLISSTAGQKTPLTAPMYTATKHAINGFVRCLAQLEDRVGVRVSAVAPGVVRTPLWTEDASKSSAVREGTDAWVEPEEVARTMLGLITEDELRNPGEDEQPVDTKGGSVVEVTAGSIRNVMALNDAGPSNRPGSTVSNMSLLEDRVWGLLTH